MKGRRIGVPEYAQTAAMTARGILQDEHGVSPRDLTWYTGGLEQPGRHEKFPLNIPGVTIHHVTDRSLSDMLEDGEIDALISARNPSCFGRNPKIVRLFRQHVAVEQDYYRRTGIHPIMHTVGVRTALSCEESLACGVADQGVRGRAEKFAWPRSTEPVARRWRPCRG